MVSDKRQVVDYLASLGVPECNLVDRLAAWKSVRGFAAKPYCYIIWRVDLDRPIPFYVGIGRRKRILDHETKAYEARNLHKAAIFARHSRLGLDPLYSIYAHSLAEAEAANLEIELISRIGRRKPDGGPLSNLTAGGDGVLGLPRNGSTYSQCRAVVINDHHYPSMTRAAEAFGISVSGVQQRIEAGWPGYKYLGEDPRPPLPGFRGVRTRRVTIEGRQFNSMKEAARHLNTDIRNVLQRIKDGREGYHYSENPPPPPRIKWKARFVPVSVNGEIHLSVNRAAEAFGVSRRCVRMRCRNPNFPSWRYAEQGTHAPGRSKDGDVGE